MKMLYYLLGVASVALFSSCEKELEVYDAAAGLNFYYTLSTDTLVNYSFIYGSSTATRDTIWLEIETMGRLSDRDRPIAFEQVATGVDDAIPGTHYVAFGDASLKEEYVVPAGRSRAQVPVVLLRDASLQAQRATLLVQIKHTEEFPLFLPLRTQVKIVFSDQLEQPINWTQSFFLGAYGQEKHLFLIEQTGEKWDYDYLRNTWGYLEGSTDSSIYDAAYAAYYKVQMIRKLEIYNAERQAEGLDVLKEADGTVVSF